MFSPFRRRAIIIQNHNSSVYQISRQNTSKIKIVENTIAGAIDFAYFSFFIALPLFYSLFIALSLGNSRTSKTRQTKKMHPSEIGVAYQTPPIPSQRGKIKSSGMRMKI